jgi:dienelactone hydrolase
MPPSRPRSSVITSGDFPADPAGCEPARGRQHLPPFLPCASPQVLLLLTLAAGPSFAADPELFNYDKNAPLRVAETGSEIRGAATVHDLSFAAGEQRVTASLVTPTAAGPHAAILYVHWLGDPATTNRTEFLDEAVALAGRGVVSLLVDTMWAKPKWYEERIPEEDFAQSVRQVIALRRAMDLLLAQPDVDPRRVAYVGHDFGAMYGMIAGGLDRRARTYVFMAGVPHFIDWALFARQPKDLAAYKQQLAGLDPVNFLPALAPAPVFFQFANRDEYVSAALAAEAYAAAGVRKQMTTYAAGHDLHTAEVAADRQAWLGRELELK